MTLKVTLENEGKTYDVTEHFQVLYDNVINSLDWGSGFLDSIEALQVVQAGAAAGFQVPLSSLADNLGVTWSHREDWIEESFPEGPTWENLGERLVVVRRVQEDASEKAQQELEDRIEAEQTWLKSHLSHWEENEAEVREILDGLEARGLITYGVAE